MYQINNFTNNDDVKLLDSLGPFTVIEYQKDLSVMPGSAQLAYYCNAMNVRKRQVICDLSKAVDGGQRQRHYRRQGGGRPVRQSPSGQRHR